MIGNIFKRAIDNKLNELVDISDSIIVLKGIPLTTVDDISEIDINLEDIVSNKLGYFMGIFGKRRFLTYEEFLLIGEFAISQYKNVYILNNNIYMKQYPIDQVFSNELRDGLINHFSETEEKNDDDTYIGDIDEYIALYSGVKEYDGYLLGVYNDENFMSNVKVHNINLFEFKKTQIESRINTDDDYFDIIEEADYINFVKVLFNEPDEAYVRISNYAGDKYLLNERILLLAYQWKDYTDIYIAQAKTVDDTYVERKEYKEILRRYWGYENFRNLPVYDMNALEEGEKKVKEVSQENIIANIVEQAEACRNEEMDFRDLFVTAPTGAGKSVMFQIPAIYLAEKYNLLTIVISPLIGLMNDQVKNLELKNYSYAKTINSDISPIVKQEIMDKVAASEYHILYISPETLLSRSDVEQLIGDRTIGMIVIDEAHIVTTWGKQFRPDYWYLGDHIKRLRKTQLENDKKRQGFVIATFTATAIYHGLEDMYTETINSLHMINPITYLGYIRRKDIDIQIIKKEKKGNRSEYEYDKFGKIEDLVKRAKITNKKVLIYFPTVALINRCYEYLRNKKMIETVGYYHGSLTKDEKTENYEKFYNKEKLVMLATKAFGMGIDINDIEIIYHFAPTGNVCDYVQEIGRSARDKKLLGEALYHYDSRDFKHINRLHGLSTIRRYQLIEVIKKIDELYQHNIQKENKGLFTKKRNAMLLDAENFSYIFGSPISDEGSNVNKVKTALLIIQKDFENKVGFSPIRVRPIPMFSIGFFEIAKDTQKRLLRKYPSCLEEIESNKHICRVMLDQIWNQGFTKDSFPKFKYLLYSKDESLELNKNYTMKPVLYVTINFEDDYMSKFQKTWGVIKKFINKKVLSSEHTAVSEIAKAIEDECNHIGKYKALAICEVVIASMDTYRKNFNKGSGTIAQEKTTVSGKTKYQFNVAVNSYFNWVENVFRKIENQTIDGKLYLVNDRGVKAKEYSVALGILEALDILSFEMLGGANSQLYIYINQIQGLKNILNAPYKYKNRLLDVVSERHLVSVKMLTYLYDRDFDSEEVWDILEDYFLGVIPEDVKNGCLNENPDINFG